MNKTYSLFGNTFAVALLDLKNSELTRIYEDIETYQEAELLSQYAMHNKKNGADLIVILPGWNVYGNIKKKRNDVLISAEVLAEKYKSDEYYKLKDKIKE